MYAMYAAGFTRIVRVFPVTGSNRAPSGKIFPKISVALFAPLKKMCLWKDKEQPAAAACFP